MVQIRLLTLALCAVATLSATPFFVAGDLVWSSQGALRLFEMTPGVTNPNASSLSSVADVGGFQAGQIAFSADGQTAYVTSFGTGSVKAISSTGEVSTFATGIDTPTGIVRTSSGRILTADYSSGNIYDITSGGDFAGTTPYATGLVNPRNFVATADGVLVIDQTAGKVVNIGNGGNLANAGAFAYGLSTPISIAYFSGRTFVANGDDFKIYEITGGGNMTGRTAFAAGREFLGLAATETSLYASTAYNSATTSIFNITSGGNFGGQNAAFFNLPGGGDSLFGAVPNAAPVAPPLPSNPSEVPEPGTSGLLGLALLAGVRKLSTR
ncbi:MAG: hypothetical protein H7039_05355 [Bryobacteraceae bacterium]|nr:hypothetical protein [Bryobacteraceae bacterium]